MNMRDISYDITKDGIFIKTVGTEYHIETKYIDFVDGKETMEVTILFNPVDTTDSLVEQLKANNKPQVMNMREFLSNTNV